jgi:hypothetical protein
MSKDLSSQIEDGWDEDDEHDPKQPAAMTSAPQDDMAMGDERDDGIAAPADQPLLLASRSKRASPSTGPGLPRKNAPLNFPGFIARSALFRAAAPNGHLSEPTTIVAALLAREVAIWTGAVIARRGRKVKARNIEAKAKFEQEQADLIPSA